MRPFLPLTCTLALAGCAHEQRETLLVPVFAASADTADFFSGGGVDVHLDEAWLELADLRLESPATTSMVSRLSPIRAAQAHPGHDFSGDTAGELLGRWTLDLLDEGLELGEATCLEGPYATARFGITGEPAVFLQGTASPAAGGERAFLFEIALEDEIAGIPFEEELDAAAPPAGLFLSVSPSVMLSFVDWSTPDGDGDDLLTTADGALGNAATFGVMSTASYGLAVIE